MPAKNTSRKPKPAAAEHAPSVALPTDYLELFTALRSRIQAARVTAHLAVNRERTLLYWDIGHAILQRQEQEGWGSAVIPRLADDLKGAFPEISGFSRRNLGYMIRFAAEWRPSEILQQLAAKSQDSENPPIVPQTVAQLATDEFLQQPAAKLDDPPQFAVLLDIPWFHNVVLLEKLKEPALRLWYAAKASENGWSRAVLVHQIESELHLRATSQANNFALTLPDPQSDLVRELVKDTYNLEFLDVRESIRERELEDALIANLRDFLLELGVGFAFIGNQYRLEVANKEYFLDLLFYHNREERPWNRTLHRRWRTVDEAAEVRASAGL